jgi:3-hydroxy-9,10-secoandrosta-1,3,5(10)-triene-9,17-dione monooxygenase reductase component
MFSACCTVAAMLSCAHPHRKEPVERSLRLSTSPPVVTDQFDFRRALGSFPTGVAIVTARTADGRSAGVTINSFASVSLSPPLVLWSLAERAPSRSVFETATHFAIHVLAEDQRSLAERFCSPAADKFAGLPLSSGLGDAPLIGAPAALFECRLRHNYPGGDHLILVGEVERYSYQGRRPLVFHGGRYAEVAEAEQTAPYGQSEFDTWQAFYYETGSGAATKR